VLLGLLVYGYAVGVRLSRRIERACTEDVAFRVICAQDAPDHAAIGRFRREHFAGAAAMDDLFSQVLVLAARAGLGKLGLVALDGTKVAANAPEDANRGERRLRELAREILAGAEAVDAAEDELYGDARGDELPPELADPVTRKDRIRRALADLDAGRKAAQERQEAQAEEFRAWQRAGQRTGCSPARVAAELARENLERVRAAAHQAKIDDWQARHAASLAATGRPLRGCPPVPADQHCRVKTAQAKLAQAQQRAAGAGRKAAQKAAAGQGAGQVRNLTDPGSRLMPVRGGGFIQGFNAQAEHSADGLCLATMVTADTTDFASFAPMMAKAQATSGLLRSPARGPLHRLRARIGTLIAGAGYCSEANLACPGPDRLIATGKRRDLETAATAAPATPANGHGGDLAPAMAARPADYPGLAAYRQRSPLAEGPSGNIKHNPGFRRSPCAAWPAPTANGPSRTPSPAC
jgi:hypothetical protein